MQRRETARLHLRQVEGAEGKKRWRATCRRGKRTVVATAAAVLVTATTAARVGTVKAPRQASWEEDLG